MELEQEQSSGKLDQRMEQISTVVESSDTAITSFNDLTVRQMVSNIKVLDKERLLIRFKDGTEIEQTV